MSHILHVTMVKIIFVDSFSSFWLSCNDTKMESVLQDKQSIVGRTLTVEEAPRTKFIRLQQQNKCTAVCNFFYYIVYSVIIISLIKIQN